MGAFSIGIVTGWIIYARRGGIGWGRDYWGLGVIDGEMSAGIPLFGGDFSHWQCCWMTPLGLDDCGGVGGVFLRLGGLEETIWAGILLFGGVFWVIIGAG